MRIDPAWIVNNLDRIGALTVEHVYLTVLAVVIGFAISFALTVLVRARPGLYEPILGVTGTMYAIPSLALFALLTPITGVGTVLTAEIALVSYTLLILTRNMVEGLRGVPADVLEAAAGMGYTSLQRLVRVELPLALPVVIAGLRIATVSTVALVTVTALTGLGGLGYLIINLGVQRGSFGATPALTGLVLCVVLAVAADLLLLGLQRALTPWARRRAST
ncbi:MAG TPA: ABC transporter permease subunit [Candidatus Limnocylindria bacterium]|nr:ABC transporter permease subunit [Candidatus Limnocylindria bacterium]